MLALQHFRPPYKCIRIYSSSKLRKHNDIDTELGISPKFRITQPQNCHII